MFSFCVFHCLVSRLFTLSANQSDHFTKELIFLSFNRFSTSPCILSVWFWQDLLYLAEIQLISLLRFVRNQFWLLALPLLVKWYYHCCSAIISFWWEDYSNFRYSFCIRYLISLQLTARSSSKVVRESAFRPRECFTVGSTFVYDVLCGYSGELYWSLRKDFASPPFPASALIYLLIVSSLNLLY